MNNNAGKQAVTAGIASRQGEWMQAGIFILVFAFAYSATLSLMVRTWFYSADAYHGVLVPFISLYFVWAGRERLKEIPVRPNILGGVFLLVIGNVILLFGRAGSVLMVELFSMVVIVPAIVLMLLGARFLRALILPLSYLVLMVPFLDGVDEIHRPFQEMSAAMGVYLLKFLGIPVFQNGLNLELPNIVLEVAVACSGLNFLLSIIAVGVPLAAFTMRRLWQKIALVTLAVAIGIAANWFRVALIGVWVYERGGGGDIHGPLHVLQGFFVSAVGFVFLFIGAWALGRFNGRRDVIHAEAPSGLPADSKKTNTAQIALILLLLVFKGYLYFMSARQAPVSAHLDSLPKTVGSWVAEDKGYKLPFEVRNADSSGSALYRNSSGRELILYISYFERQNQDKELINYRLSKLYVEESAVTVNSLPASKAVVRSGAGDYLTLFWYDIDGRITSSRYEAKFFTAANALARGRTNGAIVMVFGRLAAPDEADGILKAERDFAGALMPLIRRHLP